MMEGKGDLPDTEQRIEAKPPVEIPVHLRVLPRTPSVYAHHLLIQPTEFEVVLSFYELIPPLFNEKDEGALERLQAQGATAECVARITVSKPRFPGFVRAFEDVLSTIRKEMEESKRIAVEGSTE